MTIRVRPIPSFSQVPRALFASACVLLASSLVQATPYASQVTITGTTVSFILNQPSQSLTYSINGGAPVVLDGSTKGTKTFNLGSPTDHFSIGAQNTDATGFLVPTGGTIPTVVGVPGLSQATNQSGTNVISDDASPFSRYNSPRGVSVNMNPNSPYFGTTYISNSATGPVLGGTVIGPGNTPANVDRTLTGKGLYALNADESDAFGNGDTGVNPINNDGFPAFATVGNSFGTSTANSPYRIRVGDDGTVWAADLSDANGQLFQVQPNLTGGTTTSANVFAGFGGPGGPTNGAGTSTADGTGLKPDPGCQPGQCTAAFQNHGSIAASWTTGSLAGGNLVVYTLDEDLDSAHFGASGPNSQADRNSVWKYNIGGSIPSAGYSGTPTQLAAGAPTPASPGVANGLIGDFPLGGVPVDMARGPDGKFYVSQNRTSGAQPGILVFDATGTRVLFNSLQASKTLLGDPNAADIFTSVGGLDVSPDGKWLAMIEIDNDIALIPLINGVPDIAHRLLMDGGSNSANGRDISFDAAGNLHIVSSGQGMYREYSPGGETLTITSWNGSSFSFVVTVPEPESGGLMLLGLAGIGCGRKRAS